MFLKTKVPASRYWNCFLGHLKFITLTLFIYLIFYNTCLSQPQKHYGNVDSLKYVAIYDSIINEMGERMERVELNQSDLLNDNVHSKTAINLATVIISCASFLIVAITVYSSFQQRFAFKDNKAIINEQIDWIKEQGRAEIERFKQDKKLILDRLREAEKSVDKKLKLFSENTKDLQHNLEKTRGHVKILENQTKEVHNILIYETDAIWKKSNTAIVDTINTMVEKISEIFSDKRTLKLFEVLRSKVFFGLSDKRERIRSLQYIGTLGSKEDISFLTTILGDKDHTEEVKSNASWAIAEIKKRE